MRNLFRLEVRPAEELQDRYVAWEYRWWSRLLLIGVFAGAAVLFADLFGNFLSPSALVRIFAISLLLLVITLFNQTWGRLDRLVRDQDKILAMFVAVLQKPVESEQELPPDKGTNLSS